MDSFACAWCGREGKKMRLCTGCKKVRYCDALCQKSDWRAGHRTTCKTGSTKQDTTLLAHPCGICKARDDDDPMRGRQTFCYRCGLLICGACRPLLEARQIERCPGCRGRPRVTDLKDLEWAQHPEELEAEAVSAIVREVHPLDRVELEKGRVRAKQFQKIPGVQMRL